MTATPAIPGDFPQAPATVFLVGMGGIGMSALAQYLSARGFTVAGSDRLIEGPGRSDLMAKLRGLGITVFPQDGSGPKQTQPDVIVASAAVEAGNPDLQAAVGVPRFSRAAALATLLNRDEAPQIAVAGSAGKTTVTGWLAATLRSLGKRALAVNGGYMIDAETDAYPGNFRDDTAPDFLIVEVDESDKSLLAFSPEVGVILNIGTDHYSEVELRDVFGRFLDRCKRGSVIPHSLVADLGQHGPAEQRHFAAFEDALTDDGHAIVPHDFKACEDGCSFTLHPLGPVHCGQYGRHSAVNAAAVAAAVLATGIEVSPGAIAEALASFRGIRQRFEHIGTTSQGQPVYLDYAHNVQKIAAAIDTAREAVGGGIVIIFQPHGFGPLGFMRAHLGDSLRSNLTPDDMFVLLPVYYTGGTTSFKPTSQDVAAEYCANGVPVRTVEDWSSLPALIESASTARAILVLGARDPSLPSLTRGLCAALETHNG